MTETEFRARWDRESKMYDAWGAHVTRTILEKAQPKFSQNDWKLLLKTPTTHRIKDIDTMVQKAYLIKRYANKYDDVTDKVGTRFVVLLRSQVEVLREVVLSMSDEWVVTEARNYDEEAEAAPYMFQYQSMHFMVSPINDVKIKNRKIRQGTICEVQIRTLQQHAASELTHDRIYKKNIFKNPRIFRAVGTSIALGEQIDGLYDKVGNIVESLKEEAPALLHDLIEIYGRLSTLDKADHGIDEEIIDAYQSETANLDRATLEAFVGEREELIKRLITRNYATNVLYRQPTILLLMYLVFNDHDQAKELWPYQDNMLRPIYSHLNIRYDAV